MKKAKKSNTNNKCHSCKITAWINVVLSVILLAGAGFSIWKILDLESKVPNTIEAKKMEIFDDLMISYVRHNEVVDTGSIQEMTGYGISDEDGVFYVTFDYMRVDEMPKDCGETVDFSNVPIRHAIMYLWPSEDGGYGHAYSYHDDYYHPGGEYIKVREAFEE